MTRKYKTSYASRRPSRRFGVKFADANDDNSLPWRERRDRALSLLTKSPTAVKIWESDFVPDKASYKEHALLAEHILDAIPLENMVGGLCEAVAAAFGVDSEPARQAAEIAAINEWLGGLQETGNVGDRTNAAFGQLDLTPDQIADDYSDLKQTQEDARY